MRTRPRPLCCDYGTLAVPLRGRAFLRAAQIAFQLRRMHNEEAVLGETFPEYAAYREKTARLVPGIY